MAGINIPPELKLNIVEDLDPYSSFNFATACKDHWKLCGPVNEKHARLYAENRTINTADSGHLLWDKLNEILDDERVGLFVRELSLPSNRQTYWDESVRSEFELTNQTLIPRKEDLNRYYKAVEDIEECYGFQRCIQLYMRGRWDIGLTKGAEEPIINILVHHVPFLKVFRVTDVGITASFYKLMQVISAGYFDPVLAPKLPFQHLTTVAIAHYDSEMCCDPEWCLFFCSIPTVRNFIAYAMGGDMDRDMFDFRKRILKSNVNEMVFQYCRFEARAVENIIMNTPKLSRFSYEVAGAIVSEEVYSTRPKQVLQALVDHVSNSLEHLVFGAEDIDDTFEYESNDEFCESVWRVSLRDFRKLKTLRCDWRILWPCDSNNNSGKDEALPDGGFYTEESDPTDDFDIRTILPVSLEALHLDGPCDDREREKFTKLCDGPSDLLPNLRRIYIADRQRSEAIRTEDGEKLPGIRENPLTEFLQGQGYL